MPKIYNKIINSPTPPKNTSDIWECNGRLYLYKGGGWEALKTDSEYYELPFDFCTLYLLQQGETDPIQINASEISKAIENNKIIVMRYDMHGPGGYVLVSGYVEDLIYLSAVMGTDLLYWEFTIDEEFIYSEAITYKVIGEGGSSQADWNAQKGEAGYIKNKPFKFYNEDVEFSIPNNFLKAEDFTSYTDWDNNITIYTSKNEYPNGIADIFYMGRNDINLDYVLNGSFFIKPKHGSNGYVIPGIFGDIFLTDRYDEDAGITRLIITASLDEDVFAYKIYVDESFSLYVETLPEVYLPKTVLKTTPQTLSADAKNQALANLGIDPIVWKYICNPCIAEVGNKVAGELLKVEDGSKHFKYRNTPSIFKIKHEGNIYNVTDVFPQTLEFIKDNTTLYMTMFDGIFTEVSDMP